MSGVPRKPTKLKILEGNPGKRPLPVAEPEGRPLASAPAKYRLGKVGRDKWEHLVSDACWGQWVTEADADALGLYCVNFERFTEAESKIAEFGPVVRGNNGFPVQSVWLAVSNKAQDHMHKIAQQFGGTPASRSKVTLEKLKSGESKFAGLIAVKPS